MSGPSTNSKRLIVQIAVIAVLHLLPAMAVVMAPAIGLGDDEGFILFRLYQIPRTDALILVSVSFVLISGIAALRAAMGTVALLITLGSLFAGLFAFDRFIALRPGNLIQAVGERAATIYTLDLHPYTGWHIQPNFHHVGDLPEMQAYHNYDLRSGDLGFFIDFPLFDPPPKAKGEYRIVLIGGSGAQGFGGRTNDDMFYRKLERMLNERTPSSGTTFRVINMAMAGSVTYQNFIALNRFGHQLKPDLILSYAGANDVTTPALHEKRSDGFFDFGKLKQLAIATRPSEFPPLLRPLVAVFPNIFTKTYFGVAAKQLFPNYFLKRARDAYAAARPLPYADTQAFTDGYVVDFFVDSLKSIKRDFEGIPIMVAWQAIKTEPIRKHRNVVGTLRPGFYNDVYEKAKSRLQGYINDKWIFVNVHKILENDPSPDINTHLSNRGHTVVARLLADAILDNAGLLDNFGRPK